MIGSVISIGPSIVFLGGFLMIFLNNVWFVFIVVYGCCYYIVNAHYKG